MTKQKLFLNKQYEIGNYSNEEYEIYLANGGNFVGYFKDSSSIKDKENKELTNFKKAYNLLMEYWDSIQEEDKSKIDKKLRRLGL